MTDKRWTIVKYHDGDGDHKAAPELHHFYSKDMAEKAFEFLTETENSADNTQIDLWEEEVNRKGVPEVSVLLNREYYCYEDIQPY